MNKKSVAGGFCIGIAALANMLAPNPIIGALLFCFGLFAILTNGFTLCTGMFGDCYSLEEWKNTFGVLAGNFLGALLLSIIVYLSGWDFPTLVLYDSNLFSVFLKSVLCGMMIHIGVKSYKCGHPLVMAFAVMIFVLCGMEHCVANAFLGGFSGDEPFLWPYTINVFGNIVGAKAMNYLLS